MDGQQHTRKAIGALLSLSIAVAANANEVVIKGELDGGEPESAFESGVFGSIGADVFVGDQISRRFAAARVGFDQPFAIGTGSGRVFVEAGFAHRNASIEQTRTRTAHYERDATGALVEREPTGPETRTVDVSASGAELREAYVEYNPTGSIGLSLGYQRPVWGQFDVVSPVNLLLPLEFQSNDVAWEKSSYRMPQPMISATLFATERLELTGYWFAGTNLDPLHEEILNEGDSQNRAYLAGDYGATEMRARPRKDFSDYHAGAARMVWYADGLTLGLTYYDGRNTLFAADELPLVEPAVTQTAGTGSDPEMFDAYSIIDRTVLPKAQAFGVELSVPAGRWTWKAEAFRMSTETDIDGLRREPVRRTGGDAAEQARRELYQWILSENGGRAYADIDVLMMGAGFDAVYDRWRFGAAAFTFNTSLGAKAEEANRLVKAAFPGDDGIETDTVWLPNAYLIRDFNEERTRSTGLIGGFAGPFFGLSAFYSSTWLDDWRWTASLEYAGVVSDQMLSDVNDDDGRYELDNIATLGARIGFLYEF